MLGITVDMSGLEPSEIKRAQELVARETSAVADQIMVKRPGTSRDAAIDEAKLRLFRLHAAIVAVLNYDYQALYTDSLVCEMMHLSEMPDEETPKQ
jgi:hypothetical protein